MPLLLVSVIASLPFLGSIVYVLWKTRWFMRNDDGETDAVRQLEEHEVPTHARDLLLLAALHDARKLTDAEYAVEKTRVVRAAADAGVGAAYSASSARGRS